MSITKHTVCLLALCTIISLATGASQDQFRLKRQVEQDSAIEEAPSDDAVTYDVQVDDTASEETEADDAEVTKALAKEERINDWTSCEWKAIPKFTCYDCNTRLICKPIGGILKYCSNAATPHCRNGFCSAIPSDDCVSETETEIETETETETVTETEEEAFMPLSRV